MGPDEVSNIVVDFLSEAQLEYNDQQHKIEFE